VFKVSKFLQRITCKIIRSHFFLTFFSAQIDSDTVTTLSDHYGFRGVYCPSTVAVGDLPSPVTAVSTGVNNDENSGSSFSATFALVAATLYGAYLVL
jgi:hypothetical protein